MKSKFKTGDTVRYCLKSYSYAPFYGAYARVVKVSFSQACQKIVYFIKWNDPTIKDKFDDFNEGYILYDNGFHENCFELVKSIDENIICKKTLK